MSTCSRCQGLIAEPGKAYSYSGKFCHCGWALESLPYKVPQEEIGKFMERQAKSVQKPSMSHIINLCEQLSMGELRALIDLLKAVHDVEACSSSSEGLNPNAPSPYEVKGL